MGGVPRRAVVGGLTALVALAVLGATQVPVAAATASPSTAGLTYTGKSAALFTPTGVSVLGQTAVAANTVICNADQPSGGGTATGCNGNLTLPGGLGSINVLNENVSGSNGTQTSTSQIASVTLVPGGAGGKDVLDATVLDANSQVSCSTHTESADLATLSIAGNAIIPSNQPQNQNITVTDPLTGGTLAVIVINYNTFDATSNTATAASLEVVFPSNGELASVITGTLFISYAQSDLEGCAPPPKVPEAPMSVLFLGAGAVVLGAGWWLRRRRSV